MYGCCQCNEAGGYIVSKLLWHSW